MTAPALQAAAVPLRGAADADADADFCASINSLMWRGPRTRRFIDGRWRRAAAEASASMSPQVPRRIEDVNDALVALADRPGGAGCISDAVGALSRHER